MNVNLNSTTFRTAQRTQNKPQMRATQPLRHKNSAHGKDIAFGGNRAETTIGKIGAVAGIVAICGILVGLFYDDKNVRIKAEAECAKATDGTGKLIQQGEGYICRDPRIDVTRNPVKGWMPRLSYPKLEIQKLKK